MVAFVDGMCDRKKVCLLFYDTVKLFMSCWHDIGMEMFLPVCVGLPACLPGALPLIFTSELFRYISCTVIWNNTKR